MKKIVLTLVLPCLVLAAAAQQKVLLKGKTGKQYVEHRVGEKESLSSIGRIYDITASQLARYNGRSPSAVLNKGTILKVPVNVSSLQVKKGEVAVYHVVGKGDNLFKLGQLYNKVPVTQLRTWNGLSAKAGVQNGQEILVGYLGNAIAGADPVIAETKTVNSAVETSPLKEEKPQQKEEVPEKSTPTVAAPQKDNTQVAKTTTAMRDTLVASADTTGTDDGSYVPAEGDEGYFARLFIRHDLTLTPKSMAGMASSFKTVSGWSDRKFYVMINGITPGTIVRITAANNKSICARVLSPLPEIKGAEGLLLRMSNAAVSALGMREDNFSVNLSYFE